jgi:hypothetical protein
VAVIAVMAQAGASLRELLSRAARRLVPSQGGRSRPPPFAWPGLGLGTVKLRCAVVLTRRSADTTCRASRCLVSSSLLPRRRSFGP